MTAPARRYHEDGTLPNDQSVWVFGSNMAGRHGKGAALVARNHFGAAAGYFNGRMGSCYAIPTKDRNFKVLTKEQALPFIQAFVRYTHEHPMESFFVTRVGCGLSGIPDAKIAPLFARAFNCSFAWEWRPYLEAADAAL
jgi:hypothetical protein